MAANTESPCFNQRVFVDINHCLSDIFGRENVHSYLSFIPTYPTGMWSFAYTRKGSMHPLDDFDSEQAEIFTRQHKLKYYNPGIHSSAFCLPTFVQNMLDE